jgi:hypothetical protein
MRINGEDLFWFDENLFVSLYFAVARFFAWWLGMYEHPTERDAGLFLCQT